MPDLFLLQNHPNLAEQIRHTLLKDLGIVGIDRLIPETLDRPLSAVMTICNTDNQRAVIIDRRWLRLNMDFWELTRCLNNCTSERFAAAVRSVCFVDLPAQVALSLLFLRDRLHTEHTCLSHQFHTGSHFALLVRMETTFMLLIDLAPIKV